MTYAPKFTKDLHPRNHLSGTLISWHAIEVLFIAHTTYICRGLSCTMTDYQFSEPHDHHFCKDKLFPQY